MKFEEWLIDNPHFGGGTRDRRDISSEPVGLEYLFETEGVCPICGVYQKTWEDLYGQQFLECPKCGLIGWESEGLVGYNSEDVVKAWSKFYRMVR